MIAVLSCGPGLFQAGPCDRADLGFLMFLAEVSGACPYIYFPILCHESPPFQTILIQLRSSPFMAADVDKMKLANALWSPIRD